jgi:mannosylglycerate hydrolase
MTKRYILHVVPHIRWDREWGEPYQRRRLRLVSLLDQVLDVLEHYPDYGPVILDGQSALLEDYLEIRPENETLITSLVQDGRLLVGPWYVLPDEFLVSPEALIRNMLLGTTSAARFGRRMNVGYVPNSSGHIGQMPQLLSGFGIRDAVVIGGVGNAPVELWWEAPDGSEVLLSYLRYGGDNTTGPLEENAFRESVIRTRDRLRRHASSNSLLVMHQVSSAQVEYLLPDLIRAVDKRFRTTSVVSGDLDDYLDSIRASANEFPRVVGELRSPERFPLLTGVLSSRTWIKQRNHEIQVQLERWAEPFSAWAALVGRVVTSPASNAFDSRLLKKPNKLLDYAWQVLIKNHAALSIQGGCSDQVHREMITRFDHAEQVVKEVVQQNLQYLADNVAVGDSARPEERLPLLVFNANPFPHTDLAEATVKVPANLWPFELVDRQGARHPYTMLEDPIHDPAADSYRAQIQFLAEDVPSFGYDTYALRGGGDTPHTAEYDQGDTIENEWVSVAVNTYDGTFTVHDKRTGQAFPGLNRFVDGGDRGDTFTYCPPERDTVIDIAANTPIAIYRRVSEVEQSITYLEIYRIPRKLTADRRARLPLAAQFVPISISTTLTIPHAVPRVDVRVDVDNGALDHRLQAVLPTGIDAQEAFYDGHWEVIQRPLGIQQATTRWAEQPSFEQPQRAFVTILGDEVGLTIANRGIPEVGVYGGEMGAEIALTLLRCVGWLSRDDLPNRQGSAGPIIETPEAQCIGAYQFLYSILPHAADPLPAWQQAWAFQTDFQAVQPSGLGAGGSLPVTGSIASVDNTLFVLSAVKEAAGGNGLIVRGCNIGEHSEQVTLTLGLPFAEAHEARMDETLVGEPISAVEPGVFTFEARPYQIVTLYFPFQGLPTS